MLFHSSLRCASASLREYSGSVLRCDLRLSNSARSRAGQEYSHGDTARTAKSRDSFSRCVALSL
jgi:hypothetical protein